MIKRARGVLAELEATKHTGAALGAPDALPLFSFEPPSAPTPEPEPTRLRERLAALDPDAMSPREALAALYELKRLGKRTRRRPFRSAGPQLISPGDLLSWAR